MVLLAKKKGGGGGGGTVGPGTMNEIAYFDSANTVTSLAVATYPSLTELSYVKGVTSAIQTQLDGKVTGPASATDNAIARFDSTTGKLIQNSGATLGDDASISAGNFYLTALANGVSIEGSAAAGGRADIYATGADTNIDLYLDAQGTGRIRASKDLTVPDEAYGVGWNGSLEVPTKNAVYDKIETLSGGTPGGSNTQLQYNNAGAFGGISGATTNGTAVTFTSGNLLATNVKSPSSTGSGLQNNGGNNCAFWGSGNTTKFSTYGITEIGIDYVDYNVLTGGIGTITQTATGGSTDININLVPKGAGRLSVASVNVPTVSSTDTLTNKTLTAPKFDDLGYIADANGNELIIFDTVASAVNEITLANSATGGNPVLSATGGDANVGFNFQAKGTGTYNLLGTASQQAELRLYEDTDNGTNYVAIKTPASLAADYTLTLPTNDGDANQVLTTDGSGVLSWTTPAGTGDVTAASTFGTDNVVIKSDGTGKGVQSTGITIADTTNNMSGLQKLTVGVASTATGAIDFVGTTSGTVTVKTADAAGTWTLTLPANDGDANQVLTTNGSGVTSWTTITSGTTNNVLPTARLATTAALASNTYSAGVLTASANGVLTVDGVNVVLNDIILVKDEASGLKNGLYTCTTEGTAGVPYVLTRHTSMDATGEFVGAICPIGGEGTLNKNTVWRCTNTSAPTVGTTAITFTWEKKLSIKCRVYATGTTALTSSGTWYTVAFAGEDFDAWGMHDTVTNNSRITFSVADTYAVGASIRIDGNVACGARIRLNGSTILATQKQGNSGNPEHLCVSTIYNFSAGDYIEIQAINVSPGSPNVSGTSDTSFWTFNV